MVALGGNSGGRGLGMVQSWGVVVFVLLSCIAQLGVHAADPDPLQDFCVANLNAATNGTSVNGYTCKDRHLVTSDDFTFTGFSKPGNTTASGTGAVITFGLVTDYPALNTQGISHMRLDFEVGGVIPPHTHPLATETIFVVEGSIFTGFVGHDNVLYSQTLQKGHVFLFTARPAALPNERGQWTRRGLQLLQWPDARASHGRQPAPGHQHQHHRAHQVRGSQRRRRQCLDGGAPRY